MRGKKDEVELFHLYGLYPSKRIVDITGEIDELIAGEVCRNIKALDLAQEAPIHIMLNTPGGSVYDGLAIFDAIKNCRSHVTVEGHGQVMSMGTVIMQAADERLLTKNCRWMMHHGSTGSYEQNALDFISAAGDLKDLMERTNDIYLAKIREKKMKFTKAKLNQVLSIDTYMWPEEVISWGLADRVIGA